MSFLSPIGVEFPSDILLNYEAWLGYHWDLDKMGFTPFNMPSVAGWPAYYQEPLYYKDWINSASLAIRNKMTDKIHWLFPSLDPSMREYDFVKFIATLDNPTDINDLITEAIQILFPRELSEAYVDFFKEVVLQGLPDFEWTVEYENYLQDPTEEKRTAVENKLQDLFKTMFSIPEFQLS